MYDFSCIDFETANNNMNSACSVGIVAVSNCQIVKEDYFLIKPPTDHFRHEHVEIHGITPELVKDAHNFGEIWEYICPYFENSEYIIAHNAQFDMNVLHESASVYNIPIRNFVYMDSMNISAKVRCECGNSLAECAKYFHIPLENHHNALEDARVCAKIVISSIGESRYKDLRTYVKRFSSIKQRNFSELKVRKSIKSGHFDKIKISELAPSTAEFNTSHPLYQKNCVLTGELESIGRKEAMQKILDVGGVIKSGVSSQTHYLIVGTQDKKIVGEDGLSTKEEKAYALIKKGYPVKILTEDDFLELLKL